MNTKRMATVVAAFTFGTFVGAGLAYVGFVNRPMSAGSYHPIRAAGLDRYKFINPLLGYDTPNAADEPEYAPLANKIEKLINEYKKKSRPGSQASVYFRDSSVGRWVGINESEAYTPASLLKVAVMIAYYKSAETKPEILDQEIEYTEDLAALLNSVPFDQGSKLVIGTKYTIDRLIREMITTSDNGATYALLTQVDQKHLDELYIEANLPNPATQGRNFTIAAKDYSLLFRLLYNTTYLSRDMSEKALSVLSESLYQDGIVAGISKDVRVAHKHGSAILPASGSSPSWFELHDCGYIYYPERTYHLCVMTRGDKETEMTELIKNISQTVYQDVRSR